MLQVFGFVVGVSMESLVRTLAVIKSTRSFFWKTTMKNKCIEKDFAQSHNSPGIIKIHKSLGKISCKEENNDFLTSMFRVKFLEKNVHITCNKDERGGLKYLYLIMGDEATVVLAVASSKNIFLKTMKKYL